MPDFPGMDWLERALADLPRAEFKARLAAELERSAPMFVSDTSSRATRPTQRATPQLRVKNAAEAIAFYERAFGARELMRFEAGGRIPHAEIEIASSLVVVADEAPEYGFPSAERLGGSPVTMLLLVENADAAVARAVDAGARLVAPVADQFYGDRTGRVADPFGYAWTIVQRLEELSVDEMYRRFAAIGGPAQTAEAAASFRPEGYRTVTPYIIATDAPGLIDFTSRVFGAVEHSRSIGGAGGVHAEVQIGDSKLMIGGGAPDLAWRGEAMPTAFHVYVDDVDATFGRAVAAGAEVIQPVADMEYGERSGGVKDSSGNTWYIATASGPRPVPEGLHNVNVYLHPRRAEPLIAFLERAFGGELVEKYASPDGVVHHARLRIGDSPIEMGEANGPYQPMPTMFYVYVPDVDAGYQRAIGAGATSITPPADQPYGDRVGAVRDVFGNQWYLATHLGRGR